MKQLLIGDFQGNIKDVYRLILKNTRRLLNLINQILDLSKLESGGLKLQARKINLIPVLSGLVQSFESLAWRREIEFSYEKPQGDIEIYLDADKFEKIINNLLSNAFKHTPDGGTIQVKVKIPNDNFQISNKSQSSNSQVPNPNSKFVDISITNSGSYLSPQQIEHIFDRFYQVNESEKNHIEGSGIGLALVRELVELHHGRVDVQSDRENGTTFIVQFPLGKKHLLTEEITEIIEIDRIPEREELMTDDDSDQSTQSAAPGSYSGYRLLIVEDNRDVRKYIAGLIGSEYRIFEAENGADALALARKKNPDLILTDVMMPGMDGMEFCRQLKEDIEISHIPVIMLTARADIEDKLEGLETGADDYIAKPFDARELKLRIRNVLDQRTRMRARFTDQGVLHAAEFTGTALDEKFMKKMMDVVIREMHDPDFGVEEMAANMNMSRTSLNRKIQALTNITPSLFLRILRLRKAKELLRSGFGNVSEVANEVGYPSLSYFTRLYTAQFGLKPSEEMKSAI